MSKNKHVKPDLGRGKMRFDFHTVVPRWVTKLHKCLPLVSTPRHPTTSGNTTKFTFQVFLKFVKNEPAFLTDKLCMVGACIKLAHGS